MEKEMLAIAKFKSGEGKFEKLRKLPLLLNLNL